MTTEEQNKDCTSDNETVPYSNTKQLKSTKRAVKVCKSAKNAKKVNSIYSNQNECQDGQNREQNCQKQAKLCPDIVQDKYDLGLQVKIHNKLRLEQAKSDPTYIKWREQTDDKFGFIPLGPLVIPTSDKRRYLGLDPIKLYDVTRNETDCNFLSSQIQLDRWEKLLENYWDRQLPYLIRYGFPLDFDRNSKLGNNDKNHTFALAFPQDKDAYLKEEISHGPIYGPFKHPPFDGFTPPRL